MEQSAPFSNEEILTHVLPQVKNLGFEPLSPKYATTNRKIGLFFMALILVISAAIQFQPFFNIGPDAIDRIRYITVAIFALDALLVTMKWLADNRKFYALRENDLSFRSGLIFRKTVTQPILRVQHVEVKRGPIDRKIGLASIQVFSAGGAMHTFEIPGLPLKQAETIRQFVLEHRDVKHDG